MQSYSIKDAVCASPATTFAAGVLFVASRYYTDGLNVSNGSLTLGVVVMALLLQGISNSNDIIRTRFWMVSTVYLLLSVATHSVLKLELSLLCIPLYAFSLHFLMQSFQEYHAERWIFPSFLCLGIACLFYAPIIWMTPVFWFMMLALLNVFNVRTFLASLIALSVVAEVTLISLFATGQTGMAETFLPQLVKFSIPIITAWTLNEVLSFIIVIFVYVLARIHCQQTSYSDKIHTRARLKVIIFNNVFLLAMFIFRSDESNVLFQLLILGFSPIIAHYFTLSRGFFANIFFVLSILLLGALYTLETWSTLLHYL